ncbi:AAA family ATPase [Sedimenticola sp.]|uniref:AAA family ATPase n=1 Tax=Sedimenticola sp. TaxID=1940285 RepID=UPI003D0A8CCB
MSMEERPADAAESAESSRMQDRTPIQRRTDPFFSTPQLRQRLDLLRHLTDNSEKILLIRGASGSGKSTLLQQFRKLSREEWILCTLNADHMLQPDQFFSFLFRKFGVTTSAAMDIDELLRRFEMLHAAGRLPVIMIDDAQLLPVATLIALFRLFERRPGNRALIRVILFATPEISAQLQTPQLQAMNLQSIQSLDMPVFDADQAKAFIGFLLDTASAQESLTLLPSRIDRIIKGADGVPGVLEERLKDAFSTSVRSTVEPDNRAVVRKTTTVPSILSDLPKPVLIGTPILVLVLLLTLVFQDEINRLFGETKRTSPQQEEASVVEGGLRPLPLPELSPPAEQMNIGVGPDVVGKQEIEATTPSQSETDLALPELSSRATSEPKPMSRAPQEITREADAASMESVLDAYPEAADRELSERGTGGLEADEGGSPSPVMPPIGLDDSGQAERDHASSPVESVVADEDKLEVAQPKSESEIDAPQNRPVEQQTVVTEKPIKDEQWILTHSPGSYTLQLVGVHDEAAAKRFIKQHRLKGDIAYFKTTRSGQAWFSVIYGVYADRSAALKGRATLPPSLRKGDAWPRTYASIRAALDR